MTEQQTKKIKALYAELDQARDTIQHMQEGVAAMRDQIRNLEFDFLDKLQNQKRMARREREHLKKTIVELRAQLDQHLEQP